MIENKMRTLVVAAIEEGEKLAPATLNAVTAAALLGEVDLLLAGGEEARNVASFASKIAGVRQVLVSVAPHFAHQLAEELAPLIYKIADPYHYIVAPATTFGKNLLPRVAALWDSPQVSEVMEIVDSETFIHPVYAGNALEKVRFRGERGVLTIRTTHFAPAKIGGGEAKIIPIPATPEFGGSTFIGREEPALERPELTQARVVVAGGRGLGSPENFHALVHPLADLLGAAIGASRAAVDADYAPNDYQIGQTGKVIAPKLYFALGVSGAIQHVAGIQDSEVIVAINKDPDAPIFSVADYGLVADLNTAVPELIEALKKAALKK